PERVAQPVGNRAVDSRALSFAGALEADADLMTAVRLHRGADMECGGAEPHEVDVAGAARRTEDREVVDCLEKVRLPLAVFSDDDEPGRRRLELDVRQVAEVAHHQPIEPRRGAGHAETIIQQRSMVRRRRQVPPNRGARFSRKARVPSRLSPVAASSPNAVASRANASSSDASAPRLTTAMHCATASGPLASIARNVPAAAVNRSAAGTTRLTSPMRYASAASIISPVRSNCSARPLPTSRARRCVPP